jgi:hypothetical protein
LCQDKKLVNHFCMAGKESNIELFRNIKTSSVLRTPPSKEEIILMGNYLK